MINSPIDFNSESGEPHFENETMVAVKSNNLKHNTMIGSYVVIPKSEVSSPDFKIIEHSAGDSVNATTVESPIDVAIQTANCLNICPVIPVIKDTGTKTAINTNEVATTAPKTSTIVISVASFGDLPA